MFLIFSETSHVVSPDPVVAVADDDVILPCSLLNFTKSAGLIVKWSRSNLKDPTGKDKVVHFYRDARDSNVDQDESYRGRTSLLKELKNGNVSLKLSRVKLSDEGNYMCYILVPEPNSLVHETVIQLIVGESWIFCLLNTQDRPLDFLVSCVTEKLTVQCVRGGISRGGVRFTNSTLLHVYFYYSIISTCIEYISLIIVLPCLFSCCVQPSDLHQWNQRQWGGPEV